MRADGLPREVHLPAFVICGSAGSFLLEHYFLRGDVAVLVGGFDDEAVAGGAVYGEGAA